MNIEKVFELLGTKKLSKTEQGPVEELIKMLIEDPKDMVVKERLLDLIGATKLDADTLAIVSENLQAVIELASAELVKSLGEGETLTTYRERNLINRIYLNKPAMVNEKKDPAIEAYYNAVKSVLKVNKDNFKFDRGMHSDPMKESKDKVSVKDFAWNKSDSPLSGREYHANVKGVK